MSFILSAAQGAACGRATAVIVRDWGREWGGGEGGRGSKTQLLQDNLMCSKDF